MFVCDVIAASVFVELVKWIHPYYFIWLVGWTTQRIYQCNFCENQLIIVQLVYGINIKMQFVSYKILRDTVLIPISMMIWGQPYK